jgi:hypothetical protein
LTLLLLLLFLLPHPPPLYMALRIHYRVVINFVNLAYKDTSRVVSLKETFRFAVSLKIKVKKKREKEVEVEEEEEEEEIILTLMTIYTDHPLVI